MRLMTSGFAAFCFAAFVLLSPYFPVLAVSTKRELSLAIVHKAVHEFQLDCDTQGQTGKDSRSGNGLISGGCGNDHERLWSGVLRLTPPPDSRIDSSMRT